MIESICYLNFLRNIAVTIAVAITEIILAVIEGSLKPSGACKIYPNAIKVQKIAGRIMHLVWLRKLALILQYLKN